MREFKNKPKTSKLIFDMRLTRQLLKMNGEIKFCPFCGRSLTDNCECHKNIIIDVKKMRDSENATIAVFANLESFNSDLNTVMEKMKAEKESQSEQMIIEFQD